MAKNSLAPEFFGQNPKNGAFMPVKQKRQIELFSRTTNRQ
jgi:hypothetical protein